MNSETQVYFRLVNTLGSYMLCHLIYTSIKLVPISIIKDLLSVLILITDDQILNDPLCCSNKYN